jgi:anti-anti-sigma regulatory factor
MTDSFLLLVFPTRSLTIYLGGHRGCMGLSLRGACTTPADAAHLDQAIEQLLAKGVAKAWIDCQGLHSLNTMGQQALLHANSTAQLVNTQLYWCGLPAGLAKQLEASGLGAQLQLCPVAEFQGPQFLLPTVAVAS